MDKRLSTIGLARRAGKLTLGEEYVCKAIADKSAKLVIMAADISANGRKKITDKCNYYGTELIEYSDKEELGGVLGRDICAVVAVCDEGFAGVLKKSFR